VAPVRGRSASSSRHRLTGGNEGFLAIGGATRRIACPSGPAGPIQGLEAVDYPGASPCTFTGGTINPVVVDVSGEPDVDRERAAAMLIRAQ